MEPIEYSTDCPNCGRANENQTKCRHCENVSLKDLQRVSRQAGTLSESVGPLSRSSIHQNSAGQKSSGTGFNTKKFYSSAVGKGPADILLSNEVVGHSLLRQNGKVGLLAGTKNAKITGNLRQRNTRPSELNDPSKYYFMNTAYYILCNEGTFHISLLADFAWSSFCGNVTGEEKHIFNVLFIH